MSKSFITREDLAEGLRTLGLQTALRRGAGRRRTPMDHVPRRRLGQLGVRQGLLRRHAQRDEFDASRDSVVFGADKTGSELGDTELGPWSTL